MTKYDGLYDELSILHPGLRYGSPCHR